MQEMQRHPEQIFSHPKLERPDGEHLRTETQRIPLAVRILQLPQQITHLEGGNTYKG